MPVVRRKGASHCLDPAGYHQIVSRFSLASIVDDLPPASIDAVIWQDHEPEHG